MEVHLNKWQTTVFEDQHRFRIVCAGRRSGKSVLARLIVLNWAASQVGTYWIVSPTYKQSKQIHWREILKEIPNGWIKAKNEVELSVTLFNGSIIELKGAENPDALRGVKLRGLVVDEIASIRNWDWLWQEVLRPTLTDYSAPALFISTPKGFNHFYELYLLGQSSGSDQAGSYKSWRFTSYDNPFISKEEIDAAKQELTEDTFMQEYMADFRKFVGLVYKDFNREIHVKELPDFKPVFWIRGCDRGFRVPTAVPWVGVDKDGVWYQTDEIYEPGLTNPPLAEKLKAQRGKITPEYSTMDSAQMSDIQDLASLGEDFVPVKKESGETNQNYVRYKVEKFADRLRVKADGRAGYYVHPSCENTIHEFETYRWKEKRVNEESDINEPEMPEKANDHMMDALGDLNSMYLHEYIETMKKPWEGKVPGTYVPPADEVLEQEQGGWTSATINSDWND